MTLCKKCETKFDGQTCPNCGWQKIILVLDSWALTEVGGLIPTLVKRNFVVKVPEIVFSEINYKKDKQQPRAAKVYEQLVGPYKDVREPYNNNDAKILPIEMSRNLQRSDKAFPHINLKIAITRRLHDIKKEKNTVYFVTSDPVARAYCRVLMIPVLTPQEALELRNAPIPVAADADISKAIRAPMPSKALRLM